MINEDVLYIDDEKRAPSGEFLAVVSRIWPRLNETERKWLAFMLAARAEIAGWSILESAAYSDGYVGPMLIADLQRCRGGEAILQLVYDLADADLVKGNAQGETE